MKHSSCRAIIYIACVCLVLSCETPQNIVTKANEPAKVILDKHVVEAKAKLVLSQDVRMKDYFDFMDSLVNEINSTINYKVDEHILVRSNPWIIDTLQNTDYYTMKSRGITVLDPQALTILRKDQSLHIPDSIEAAKLWKDRRLITIDVNIPEFKLRIIDSDSVLYTFSIRVGQPTKKYLAMAGREVDLHTQFGVGEIVRINKEPTFINPSNNHVYKSTRRDDGIVTKLPFVPWLEPMINGQQYGQLIHPTTNPATLGKAYSNGCIGLGEGDMWRVYYYAPVGTKVKIRYDLEVLNDKGDTVNLDNIYNHYLAMRERLHTTASISLCHCGIL